LELQPKDARTLNDVADEQPRLRRSAASLLLAMCLRPKRRHEALCRGATLLNEEESALTYYLSGVPKARPLEGLVSWRVSDAPLKGLIECASERSGARLRWKWQRLICIRSLYFKLGAMANASTRAGQSRAQVSLAAAQCAARLRRRYQALHLYVPVRLDLGSKGGREGNGVSPVKVKIEAIEEHTKPRSYTS